MDPRVSVESQAGVVPPTRGERLRRLPLRDLVVELAHTGRQLARKELELVRVEARQDLRTEIRTGVALGVAGVCALIGIQLLLTAVVLALMQSGILPGWAAALIVAAVVLAVGATAGLWGWDSRVRRPLDTTVQSARDSVRWVRRTEA